LFAKPRRVTEAITKGHHPIKHRIAAGDQVSLGGFIHLRMHGSLIAAEGYQSACGSATERVPNFARGVSPEPSARYRPGPELWSEPCDFGRGHVASAPAFNGGPALREPLLRKACALDKDE